MDKKTKMADEVPSWNVRNKNNEFTINTVIFKSDNITQEISDELKKRLSIMSRYVAKSLLWPEMNTMKSVIYKHHNQHRKEKYFQGIKRIQKNLSRLREMKLETLLSSFVENMPKKNSKSTAVNSYPCLQAIEYVLFNFMGAAKLIAQGIGHCKSTINFAGGHLSKGFFMNFHIVIAASLSRIWVLLKDFLQHILECYQKLYRWLGLLQETAQGDKHLRSDLPTCLKTWIISTELDNTLFEAQSSNSEPDTPQTSVVLEKLFLFTPASEQKLVTSSLLYASCTDDVQPADDIGERFDATSLNSTQSLLDTSELVPRELFQGVSTNDAPQSLKRCGLKRELKSEIELFPHKRLHLDEEASHETTCTGMAAINGDNLIKGRPWRVIHCPNKKLRHSTLHGTFKIPCMGTKRVICNSRILESKKKKRKLQDKSIVQHQLQKGKNISHSSNYKRKRIFINVKCSKSNYKRTLKKKKKKYQSRWKRKIKSTIEQRKSRVKKNENLVSWNDTHDDKMGSSLAPNLDSSFANVNKVYHCRESKEQSSLCEKLLSVSRKYSSDISSLEKLEADEKPFLPRKEESDRPSEKIVQESKSSSLERNLNQSMKKMSNVKMLHHQGKDDVDDIFDLLGL